MAARLVRLTHATCAALRTPLVASPCAPLLPPVCAAAPAALCRSAGSGRAGAAPSRGFAADAAPAAPAYTISELPASLASVGGAGPSSSVRRGWFVLRNIHGHSKKLNPLARQIAGLSVPEALAQMAFSPARRARAVREAVTKATWNADFYHALPPEKLMVERAWTGNGLRAPRIVYHARGKSGRAHYRTTSLSVRLREMSPQEEEALVKFKTRPTAESRARLDARAY